MELDEESKCKEMKDDPYLGCFVEAFKETCLPTSGLHDYWDGYETNVMKKLLKEEYIEILEEELKG